MSVVLFCYILDVMLCVKKNKMLITKKKTDCIHTSMRAYYRMPTEYDALANRDAVHCIFKVKAALIA